MIMPSGLRKAVLTAHVTSLVGWLGALAAFLVLAIAGLATNKPQTGRAAYLAMELIAWFAIVSFNAASLISGILQSLGTHWGLFRHYWVLIKLAITILATIAFVIHMQPISIAAAAAADATLLIDNFRNLRIQLVVDAGAALLVFSSQQHFRYLSPAARRGMVGESSANRSPFPDFKAAGTTRLPTGTIAQLYNAWRLTYCHPLLGHRFGKI